MAVYCYPRGFVSRFCDGRSKLNDDQPDEQYTTHGSEVVGELMNKMSSSFTEVHYQEEVIRAAVNLFGNFERWVEDNLTLTPFLNKSCFKAISSLMDCVEHDIAVDDTILVVRDFVPVYPVKGIYNSDKSLLSKEINARFIDDHCFNTDDIIRCIIKNSDKGILALLEVIDFFFGYVKNKDGYNLESLRQLVGIKVNSAKGM